MCPTSHARSLQSRPLLLPLQEEASNPVDRAHHSAVLVHNDGPLDSLLLKGVDQLCLVRGAVRLKPRDHLPHLFDPLRNLPMPRGRRDIPLPELLAHKDFILIQGRPLQHVALFIQAGNMAAAFPDPMKLSSRSGVSSVPLSRTRISRLISSRTCHPHKTALSPRWIPQPTKSLTHRVLVRNDRLTQNAQKWLSPSHTSKIWQGMIS